jgi:hypothetical protein
MKNKLKSLVFALLLVVSFATMAQPSDQDITNSLEETQSDAAAAPIDDYLIPVLLIGVIGGCYLIRKKVVL